VYSCEGSFAKQLLCLSKISVKTSSGIPSHRHELQMHLEWGEGNKRRINTVSTRSTDHVNFQTSKIISNSTSAATELLDLHTRKENIRSYEEKSNKLL
jgi:hypothetical protein